MIRGRCLSEPIPHLYRVAARTCFAFMGVGVVVKMSQASDSDPRCRVWTQGKVDAVVAFNTPAETQLAPPVSNGKASIGQVDSYPIP